MKFKLYRIELLLWEVDESYDSEAEIIDKFISISTPHDSYRNRKNDKFHFDFSKDNTYKKHSTEKVNTKFKIYSADNPDEFGEFYAHINFWNFLKLSSRFGKLWIQEKENIMWLTNIIVLIVSMFLSTYVALELYQKEDNPKKFEIINPIKIEKNQLKELKGNENFGKQIRLDSNQVKEIIDKIKK